MQPMGPPTAMPSLPVPPPASMYPGSAGLGPGAYVMQRRPVPIPVEGGTPRYPRVIREEVRKPIVVREYVDRPVYRDTIEDHPLFLDSSHDMVRVAVRTVQKKVEHRRDYP